MAGRWVKYWFVLHNKNLFYYKDPEVVVIRLFIVIALYVIEYIFSLNPA